MKLAPLLLIFSQRFSIMVDPKQIEVIFKSEKKKRNKDKKKKKKKEKKNTSSFPFHSFSYICKDLYTFHELF